MAVRRNAGRTKVIKLPKIASVAVAPNAFIKADSAGNGTFRPCISDTGEKIFGVSRDSWTASDTTTGPLSVEVPLEQWVEWLIDTDSDGGLADSDVGNYRDLDTTGANLDASASTDKVLLVLRKVSATKGVVVMARTAINTPSSSA